MAPEAYFSDLTPGDFVVHIEYGVGVFQGLVTRAIEGAEREYLLVEYGGNDRLYVPIPQADRLARYVGVDDRTPTLSRLGTQDWRSVKARARAAAEEVAGELVELYAAREIAPGHAFMPDTPWQAELEAAFPYYETSDQLRAIADVKDDMERARPMDRIICGDVGYGKTEVAIRAAFKAVMGGKQVAILVPTTVLAQQHYSTFVRRLAPFPVVTEMLSRFRTHAEQRDILQRVKQGQVDIVIGTHRLLQNDVSFSDLGLLVVDEEQRFGVTHKERLKEMRTEVDVLTMTATPIPRTLYMALTGVRDISTIETPPEERLPVTTYVGEYDDQVVRRAILREMERSGQVFNVHNRVQTIRSAEKRLRSLVPEASMAVAHGQMRESELEGVMVRFVEGDVDVLVCTTIIESGLDIPNANTLIVERAHQFGLAQLYQLRGRVGRGAQRAYAYVFHDRWSRLNPEARQRLETIRETTNMGAGYTIAMRDLEIRGAGEILGTRQSGHIAAVGFELYTRLLAQSVRELKAARDGMPLPKVPLGTIRIDLGISARLPVDYVPDSKLRLQIYRRLAGLGTLEEIAGVAQELADRFGPLPPSALDLLYQLRLKVMASEARVASIMVENGRLALRSAGEDFPPRESVLRAAGDRLTVSRRAIWLPVTDDWRQSLEDVLSALGALAIDG
jgi:transcription-repair coupling factor (superfamily II helicase)